MIEQLSKIKSGRSEIRQFSFLIGAILLFISAAFFWTGKEGTDVFFGLGVLIIIAGIVSPIVLKPIYLVWMLIAFGLGWIMTRVILCLLFYLVLTPIGLISRLLGKKFLELKFDVSKESYWHYQKNIKTTKKTYERQF